MCVRSGGNELSCCRSDHGLPSSHWDVVDETHGFHYFEGCAIFDFIDGTANPVGEEEKEWAIIDTEDPEFINRLYSFA